MLNDGADLAGGITHDTAIARRVSQVHGQQAQLLRAHLLEQALQGVDFDQRYVAVQHQHIFGGQKWQGLRHGVAGTQLLVLQHKVQVISGQTLADQFGTMADDHVNTGRLKLAGAVDNMPKHGITGHRVKDLG